MSCSFISPTQKKEYILFKFELVYAPSYRGPHENDEIGIYVHYDEDQYGDASTYNAVEGYDEISGNFSSVNEAMLRIAVIGWNAEDCTSRFKNTSFLGRRCVGAWKLTKYE